jgi:hypothetical protein
VLSACASSAEHFVPSFTRFLHPSKGGENRPIEIAVKVAMRKLAWHAVRVSVHYFCCIPDPSVGSILLTIITLKQQTVSLGDNNGYF